MCRVKADLWQEIMMQAFEINKKLCDKHGLQYFFLNGGCEKCQDELYKSATVTITNGDKHE